ncbi:glycosyltransferase family 4 protein [Aquicoccus sp. G2-2]|uniref:glycosyltransferase family 4 protein n=1 Tax=Aquicoccus sp. G2-2 TaxID=3092120 RepID=UPI002AE044D9|nr:glycosyltransferase family 4 protein [Aquicoccus sp. G2-2]MEA1112575.1 glycosyltransferase family 4 protein [Aquicoccus sp. G2-2]
MPRLKIAYLCDISPEHTLPYSGGNAQIFRALSDHADLTILPQSWGMAEPLRRAIYALPVGAQLRLRWRAHLAAAPLIARPLNRQLKAGDFDVVLGVYSLQSMSHIRPPPGALSAFMSDATPTVYRRSAIGRNFGASWVARRLVDPLVLRAERRILNATDLLLWPTDWLKRAADPLYGLPTDKAHVIPWGANIDDPGAPPARTITGGPLNLLVIGRDWFAKGGPMAFDTMQALRTHGIDARLTVIGATPPAFDQNKHVTLLGPLDKARPDQAARFAAALRQAHFLVQPSIESFGFAFCEAAAFGLPALCLAQGGVPVRDGVTGHALLPGATAADFAARVLADIETPARYDALCKNARAEYETTLNWRAWAASAVALMEEKLAAKRR